MNRGIHIARAGSVCNGIEQIKEVYNNHAKLIQELLVKTKLIDELSTDISALKDKETATPDEIKTLQNELTTLRTSLKDIDALKEEIGVIKSDENTKIKKELLDALDKSIPVYSTPTDEDETEQTREDIKCTYPFEVPKSEDGTDGWNINGIEVIPTTKDDQRLCSIKTNYGGIAIDKEGSNERWILERNTNNELKLHYNSETSTPLTVESDGITTPKLTIGDKYITSIVTAINPDTISSKSVPTTKALIDYVNANIIKSNVTSAMTSSSAQERVIISQQTLPSCNVSTIETSEGKSLLITNETSSFSVKKNGEIVTVKPSLANGLTINDSFKLANDSGMLCILVDDGNMPDDIEGRYVEYTGNVIEMNDILILEVSILNGQVTAATCGVIGKDLENQKTFTHGNRINKLPECDETGKLYHFVTIFNSGIHYVKTDIGEFSKGMLLVPSKCGLAVHGTDKLQNFCAEYRIPRAKVISIVNDKLVAMLV